ncbi:LOW QUALITY PROTEIN: uncharacterized protein LOC100179169 [Ciona intestinalis]
MTPEEYDGPDACNFVKVVRKLRKRLRQIQRLETCGRDLTTEERIKLECKNDIQRKLREILAEINRRDESFNSSVDVNKEINVETDEEDSHEFEPDDQHEEKLEKEKNCVFQNNENTESVVVAATVEQTNVTASKVKQRILHEWKSKPMFTTVLEGHHDIITSVDCDGNWLVSGSQDTSVKVWDLNSMEEVRNMTGHSGCVTCVQILNNCESDKICKVNSMEFKLLVDADGEALLNKQKLLLTSSLDCFIKLWVIPDGCCVKSIYIYSPLTAMIYSSNLLFTGTVSGKLVVCDILSGSLIHESIIHTQEISSLKWHCNHLVTTSFDGSVKVWEATCDLHETAVSEREHLKGNIYGSVISNESSGLITGRHIHCVASWNDKLIIGDDGTNLKVVELGSGNITRFPNHKLCSGFTNSMFIYKDLLFATSYNVDTGKGAINVRSLCEDVPLLYLATFTHSDMPQLTCACVDQSNTNNLCFFTGGSKLMIWKTTLKEDEKKLESSCVEVVSTYIQRLNKTASPSDGSSSSETEDEGGWWWTKQTILGKRKRDNDEIKDFDLDSSKNELQSKPIDSRTGWCMVV